MSKPAKTSGQLEAERIRKRNAENNKIVITDYSVCWFCKTKGLTEADKFCPNCAFPQHGTEAEQHKFAGAHMIQKIRLEEMEDAVIKARNMLFAISGLTVIPYLIGAVQTGQMLVLYIGIFIGALYGGLALWSRKQPFPAILTAFILYISLWALYIALDARNIYAGIWLKFIGLSALYYGFKAARSYETMKKLVDLKSTPVVLDNPIPEPNGTEPGAAV